MEFVISFIAAFAVMFLAVMSYNSWKMRQESRAMREALKYISQPPDDMVELQGDEDDR